MGRVTRLARASQARPITMANDRRVAEWLSPDACMSGAGGAPPADEGSSERPLERVARHGDPTMGRLATVPRRRRLPAALAFEGQEARILELVEALGRRIRRRPLAALAAGVGLGFVIGGALSFRAGRILLAAGARHAARELLKQLL